MYLLQHKTGWFLSALIVIGLLTLSVFCPKPSSIVKRQNCKQQLRSLGCVIVQYRQDHTNQWPATVESLDSSITSLLTCPGVPKNSSSAKLTDYVYVNWSVIPHSKNADFDKYPLMYDRSVSNHYGGGINVLTVGGVVEWDANAEKLKKFADAHPEAKLVIP